MIAVATLCLAGCSLQYTDSKAKGGAATGTTGSTGGTGSSSTGSTGQGCQSSADCGSGLTCQPVPFAGNQCLPAGSSGSSGTTGGLLDCQACGVGNDCLTGHCDQGICQPSGVVTCGPDNCPAALGCGLDGLCMCSSGSGSSSSSGSSSGSASSSTGSSGTTSGSSSTGGSSGSSGSTGSGPAWLGFESLAASLLPDGGPGLQVLTTFVPNQGQPFGPTCAGTLDGDGCCSQYGPTPPLPDAGPSPAVGSLAVDDPDGGSYPLTPLAFGATWKALLPPYPDDTPLVLRGGGTTDLNRFSLELPVLMTPTIVAPAASNTVSATQGFQVTVGNVDAASTQATYLLSGNIADGGVYTLMCPGDTSGHFFTSSELQPVPAGSPFSPFLVVTLYAAQGADAGNLYLQGQSSASAYESIQLTP